MKKQYKNFKLVPCIIFIWAVFSSQSFANSCKLFEHENYDGHKIKIHKNQKLNYVGNRANDKISSVKVPSGCKLVTFIDANFEGGKKVFKSDTEFVGRQWNDQISSAKCKCNDDDRNDADWGNDNGNNNTVRQCMVFQHADFQGRSFSVKRNKETAYVGNKMNDQISSVKVPSNCRLIAYEDADFSGSSREFRTNSLLGKHWNDKISSFECNCR